MHEFRLPKGSAQFAYLLLESLCSAGQLWSCGLDHRPFPPALLTVRPVTALSRWFPHLQKTHC